MPENLTSGQVRGARGMLGWSMFDLAQAAEVSVSTIKRIEYDEAVSLSDNIRSAVRAAFEIAGITFIADDGRGVGLRFKADSDQHRRPAC